MYRVFIPRLPKKFHQGINPLNFNGLAFSLSKAFVFRGILSPLSGLGNLYVLSFRRLTPPAKHLRSFGASNEEALILMTYVVDEIFSATGGFNAIHLARLGGCHTDIRYYEILFVKFMLLKLYCWRRIGARQGVDVRTPGAWELSCLDRGE